MKPIIQMDKTEAALGKLCEGVVTSFLKYSSKAQDKICPKGGTQLVEWVHSLLSAGAPPIPFLQAGGQVLCACLGGAVVAHLWSWRRLVTAKGGHRNLRMETWINNQCRSRAPLSGLVL